MARTGAMAKNPPPLRGKARRDFRQAQREAVASGGAMPTQAQFRPKAQPTSRPQPTGNQMGQQVGQPVPGTNMVSNGSVSEAVNAPGQMPPDKMFRYPQPGNQAGAALGAAMEGAGIGNIAGSRSEGSPVFNAFPGNNPANLNDANIGRFDNMRYPGGSATFNENPNDMARPAVMPDNYSNQQQQQFLQFLQQGRQGGQVQDGMYRSPGVPMRNIPGMEQQFQNGLGQTTTQAVPANWKPSPEALAQKQAYMQQMRRR